MLLFVGVAISSHVPGYGCDDGCCHATHDVSRYVDNPKDAPSQAYYLRDDGGLEFETSDFVTTGRGQVVYVDLVFKEEYARDAYEVAIGCGGCHPTDNFSLTHPLPFEGYGRGKVEVFTQHPYRSFFNDEWRTFNTSVLETCSSDHWSIRLRTLENATKQIHWSAVVGRAEKFTLRELFLFPLYVLRNHGSSWNRMAESFPIIAGLVVIGVVCLLLYTYGGLGLLVATTTLWSTRSGAEFFTVQQRDATFTIRSILYLLAVLAIATDILETFFHFLFSISAVNPSAGEVWTFLFLVLFIGKIFPLVTISLTWDTMRRHSPFSWVNSQAVPFCVPITHPIYAHVGWAWLEILSGVSFYFLFGLGFWIAPGAYALAGVVRLADYQYTLEPHLSDITAYQKSKTSKTESVLTEENYVPVFLVP